MISKLIDSHSLLQANNKTNFVFRIMNSDSILSANEMDYFSSINLTDHTELFKEGINFSFEKTEEEMLSMNFQLIDSALPLILSHLLTYNFKHGEISSFQDLLSKINRENPLGYKSISDYSFYSTKIKRFLLSLAYGMNTDEVWLENYEQDYDVIKIGHQGEERDFNIYMRNELQEYLLNNTQLSQASNPRYGAGKLYLEDGKLKIKLNLQIRFIK